MHHGKTWFAALALVGGCYVETPKHEAADAEAIRASARDAELDATDTDLDAAADAGAANTDAASADSGEAGCDCDANGDTPVCLADGSCVACTATSDTCSLPTPYCDVASHRCVACETDTQCTADAPVCSAGECVKCTTSSPCRARLDGKPVCSEGACVECTSADVSACPSSAGKSSTCSALTHVCTGTAAGSVRTCGACLSDADCETGSACVETAFGATPITSAHYCMLVDTVCDQHPPYLRSVPAVVSIDGAVHDVCDLSISTCAAHADFKRTFCGVTADGEKLEPPAGSVTPLPADHGDDKLCGAPEVSDGFCIETAPSSRVYRCTVACTNGVKDDCPADARDCVFTTRPANSRYLCSL